MNRLQAGMLALSLLGPSAVTARASTVDREGTAAVGAYMQCMVNTAKAIDDHRSDASTIAKSIQPACPTQFEKMKAIAGRNLSPDGRTWLNDAFDREKLQDALRAVLLERAASRGSSD